MTLQAFDLSGRVALVTGASRGLGKAMALALAGAGADMVLAARGAESLEQTADEVQGLGRRTLIVPTDVTQVAQIERLMHRAVEHFGRLDVLIPAAGINIRGPSVDFVEADWDRVMAVNLKGVFFTCQAAGRVMIEQGSGSIITVASLTTTFGFPGIAPYCASKGGVGQLTKSLASEWAPYGVRVNAVAPGYYRTVMTEPLFQDPDFRAYIQSRIPMDRPGVPEDLGGTVVFLASDASAYVTGQVLYVDGGWTAR
jgi:NAD(P)-dependent dehydrogenase (short-subunit alcohol dehydrogenase family)